jgi:hypothetical protein
MMNDLQYLFFQMSLKYRHAFKQTLCGASNRRSRNSGGGGGLLADRRAAANVGVNRSYTFKSTSKTGSVKIILNKYAAQLKSTFKVYMGNL